MLLDYKDIIIKHYALGMSGREIAEELSASKSGVNKFLAAFKECKSIGYPLPQGITNYGIAAAVYGKSPAIAGRDLSYEMPDYEAVAKDMSSRKNMTLVVLWNRYAEKNPWPCHKKFHVKGKSGATPHNSARVFGKRFRVWKKCRIPKRLFSPDPNRSVYFCSP